MNTSIIIDDIRKRSIRLQREQLLEQLKHEEDFESMTIPKRIILEAEERAKERVSSQGWKKTVLFTLFLIGLGYLLYKYIARDNGKQPMIIKPPKPELVSMSIQTEEDIEEPVVNEPKRVSFQLFDKEVEFARHVKSRELRTFYKRNFTEDWLVNKSTGKPMTFDFYNDNEDHAIDIISREMLIYPNDMFETQEDFEMSIYERELKKQLCRQRSIEYEIIVADNNE